jgi:hypothetical protein
VLEFVRDGGHLLLLALHLYPSQLRVKGQLGLSEPALQLLCLCCKRRASASSPDTTACTPLHASEDARQARVSASSAAQTGKMRHRLAVVESARDAERLERCGGALGAGVGTHHTQTPTPQERVKGQEAE